MSTMPAVPDDLHCILAKSDPRESLVEHTWNVLCKLADQVHLRPGLPEQVGEPRLWHQMYWACFLHDFGKAAQGFQRVLTGQEKSWKHRHEALSLAFVDWLFPAGSADRRAVISVIACHHRDADFMAHDYAQDLEPEYDRVTRLLNEITNADRERLHRWLSACSWQWADALGLSRLIEPMQPPPLDRALKLVRPSAVHQALRELKKFAEGAELIRAPRLFTYGAILRGLILTSDHAGSAHAPPYPRAELPSITQILTPERDPYTHQTASAESRLGSAILIAPTSSGKTEAALAWASRQAILDGIAPARLFYALPYQASMNAMWDRLRDHFPPDLVGLQHGRARLTLYRDALERDEDQQSAQIQARAQQELARLNFQPVRIFSPYQMLKAAYRLKGFEGLLTDYYNALFIFDEVHAYEPKRLALIVALMRLLHDHFRARFFVMTATLPPMVHQVLVDALGTIQTIEADAAIFRRFQRHRIHLLSDDLLSPAIINRVVEDRAAGRSVLVCCNTVRRAREMFDALCAALPDQDQHDLILVHSRFNTADRLRKEGEIKDRVGVGAEQGSPPIVVATQVVEVSLNIDLDRLYTEPAPLEALLQRFGRVNRGHPPGSSLADVFVSQKPGPFDNYIYTPELVEEALRILATVDGQPIDEGQVGNWLKLIYKGSIVENWLKEFNDSIKVFEESVLRWMKPFLSATKEEAAAFGKLFDGVEALPVDLEEEYDRRIEAHHYISASELLVPIAWRDVKRLERKRLAWQEDEEYFYRVNVPYNSDFGLDLLSVFRTDAAPEAD